MDEKILKNFVRKYGKNGLIKFMNLCERMISSEEIGREFDVSRQTVQKWKAHFSEIHKIKWKDIVWKYLY